MGTEMNRSFNLQKASSASVLDMKVCRVEIRCVRGAVVPNEVAIKNL